MPEQDGGAPVEAELTSIQRSFWNTEQAVAGTAALHMSALLHLKGVTLDAERLAAALGDLVREQEMLRTVFRGTPEHPVQVVLPGMAIEVGDHRLDADSAQPSDERLAAARRIAEQVARQPFDLRTGPLWRVARFDLGADDLLLIVAHQLVADGFSLTLVAKALIDGKVEPSPVTFLDYAARQRERLATGGFAREAAYWRGVLDGATARTTLPADRPRTPRRDGEGPPQTGIVVTHLSEPQHAAIGAVARNLRRTPLSVLLAAYFVALARVCGHHEPVVGMAASARNRTELQKLVGPLRNYVPVRARLTAGERFGDLVTAVHQSVLDAIDHSELPFPALAELVGASADADADRQPVFQTQFYFGRDDRQGIQLPPPVVVSATDFDLAVGVDELRSTYEIHWKYPVALYDHATVAAFAADYEAILAAVIEHPDVETGELLSGPRPTLHEPADPVAVPLTTLVPLRVAQPRSRLRLLCFPHGGGMASTFREWQSLFGDEVEVWAIELPGRGRRRHEPPHRRIQDAVDDLVRSLAPELGQPFAVFGHSVGADLAYALTAELLRRGLPAPEHLFVAAQTPPVGRVIDDPLHLRDDAELIARLGGHGGIPAELLEKPDALAPAIPRLRADLELSATYTLTSAERLDVPITAFGGLHDRAVHAPDLQRWGELTSRFQLQWWPGGHFFVHEDAEEVVEQIRSALAAAMRQGPRDSVGAPPESQAAPRRPLPSSSGGSTDRDASTNGFSPTEREVVAALADAAPGIEAGLDDNFFDAGLTSIALLRLQSELATRGHDLEITDFFYRPTIRRLAEALDDGGAESE